MKKIIDMILDLFGDGKWHFHNGEMRRRVTGKWETRPATEEEENEALWWFSIR